MKNLMIVAAMAISAMASAKDYAHLTVAGDVPDYAVPKYLVEMPLSGALATVLPEGWHALAREDVAPPKTMTATRGENWLDVLDRTAMDSGVSVQVDGKKKEVRFVPAPIYKTSSTMLPVVGERVVRTTGAVLPAGDVDAITFGLVQSYGYELNYTAPHQHSPLPITIMGETLMDDLRAELVALGSTAHLKVTVDPTHKIVTVDKADGASTLSLLAYTQTQNSETSKDGATVHTVAPSETLEHMPVSYLPAFIDAKADSHKAALINP